MRYPTKYRVRGPFVRLECYVGGIGWCKSSHSVRDTEFVRLDEASSTAYDLEREVSRLRLELQIAEHRALMAELDLEAERKPKFNTAEFHRAPRPPRKLAAEVVDELADRLRR